jgi:hypothetical protein
MKRRKIGRGISDKCNLGGAGHETGDNMKEKERQQKENRK